MRAKRKTADPAGAKEKPTPGPEPEATSRVVAARQDAARKKSGRPGIKPPSPTSTLLDPYDKKIKRMVETLATILHTLEAVDLKATHIADSILHALQVPENWELSVLRLKKDTASLQDKLREIHRVSAATHNKEVCYTEIFAYARLSLATQLMEPEAFIALVGRLCRLVEALPDAWWYERKEWLLREWMDLMQDGEAVDEVLNQAARAVTEERLDEPAEAS